MDCKKCGIPLSPTEVIKENELYTNCELLKLKEFKENIPDCFRIQEIWKYKKYKNPISGHEWKEPIKLIKYRVHSGFTYSDFKSLAAAEEWQRKTIQFYKKFFPEFFKRGY